MRQPREMIAAAALIAAALMPAATAHAQQAPVNSNRLMFDPNGLQGTENRTFAPQQPASTIGQQVTSPKPPAAPPANQAATPKPPAAPAAKQAAAPKPQQRATPGTPPRTANARRPPATEAASDTPSSSRAAINAAPIEPPRLGRVPLTTGTFGFENQTQLKDHNMSDGRKVPGFDNIQRNDSSYFGLSLRVPTGSSAPSFMREHGAN